jgi:hypothetical protein
MLLKKLILLISLNLSIGLNYAQEQNPEAEKKEFNFSSPTLITSYVVMGAGVLIVAGISFSSKPIGGSAQNTAAALVEGTGMIMGVGTIAVGGTFGLVDTIHQLIDIKRSNKELYSELIEQYQSSLTTARVFKRNPNLNSPSISSFYYELMSQSGLSEGAEINDFNVSFANALVAIDNLGMEYFNKPLDEKLDEELAKKSEEIACNHEINYDHVQNLLALKLSSLL